MSEIIRDAIIRLKLETQRSRVEMPEVDKISRAYEDQRIKSEQVRVSVEQTQRSVQESTKVHQEFGQEAVKSFRHGLEGTIQFARGVALMTASGEEDTRKLLESFAKIEAATALIKGAVNLAKFAGGFGPVGVAVAGVAAAVGTGITIWNRYANSVAEAAKAQEEARKTAADLEMQLADNWSRQNARQASDSRSRLGAFGLRSQFALTDRDKLTGLAEEESELTRLQKENELNRRRRLKSFEPGAFGGSDKDAFAALLKFGTTSQLTNALSYETTRQDLTRRQLEIDKEQYDTSKKQLDNYKEQLLQRGQATFGLSAGTLPAGLGGFAGFGTALVTGAQVGKVESDLAALLAAQQKANQAMFDLFTEATEKARQLRKELDSANPQ